MLYANIGGSSLCMLDVGGSFGHDLAGQGETAMVAFASEWLVKLFGSDIAGIVKRSSVTRWDTAPYVMGAMSAAAPGGQAGRRVLMEPSGALFLAGEATHETMWGTVGGAWDSGERAADAALKKIGGIKEAEPAKPSVRRGGLGQKAMLRRVRRGWRGRGPEVTSWRHTGSDSSIKSLATITLPLKFAARPQSGLLP